MTVIHKSTLPKLLRQAAKAVSTDEPWWVADVCEEAAYALEVHEQRYLREPTENGIEEGDIANG